jgi:hypothetical protein
MLVVKGKAGTAQAQLFDDYCDPSVEKNGRSERLCRNVPRTSRLFVGYGLFGDKRAVKTSWKQIRWSLWIDGRRIRLTAFGHSDRTASRGTSKARSYMREWNVTLVGANPGHHTIRYRTQGGSRTDTIWKFTVVGDSRGSASEAKASTPATPSATDFAAAFIGVTNKYAKEHEDTARAGQAHCVQAAPGRYMCSYTVTRSGTSTCHLMQARWTPDEASTINVTLAGRTARCATLREAIRSLG